MCDEISEDPVSFNRERWNELAEAGVAYSQPWLNLDAEGARQAVDPEKLLGELRGRRVLCLAGGGGQQSVAFALLGAKVTVLDLSEKQLERDQQAAEHYGVSIMTLQGDMRDLSQFSHNCFDVVWHAHALSFVPDADKVLRQVRRVTKVGGWYRLSFHNPYTHGMEPGSWTGTGYELRRPCEDGAEIVYTDHSWDVTGEDGETKKIQGPREFRHNLEPLMNGLIDQGFSLMRLRENDDSPDANRADPQAAPGSWEHFCTFAPPYLCMWWRLTG